MIYVNKKQYSQVEYLIQQSIQGNHILFDTVQIRDAYWLNNDFLNEHDAFAVEHHLEKVILQPSLAQKKAYLEGLDPETYQKVIKTYFFIVENNIYETQEVRH